MSELVPYDLKSFEAVFKEYYSSLLIYAMNSLRDRSEAEDIVQEVFYSFWKSRDSIEISYSIKSYLFGAVKRQCQNKLRHRMVIDKYEAAIKASHKDVSIDPEEVFKNKELRHSIKVSVDNLPEKARKVFVMNRYEGKKYQEIASELNISLKTVEAHMTRALKKLRAALTEYAFFILITLSIHG